MATNFPGSLDSFTNPTATDTVDAVDHAGQHEDANDAITAVETKVGIDGSADTTTFDYKLAGVTTGDQAVSLTGTETLTNKSIDANNNTLTNIGNDAITASAGIDATKIADGSVDNTEFQYINSVTSNVQDQIDSKPATTTVTLDSATDLSSKSWFLDEDDLNSDDATKVASQQSIKAYVDAVASGILTATRTFYTADATWNKPTGLEYIEIEVVGGGGGSGGVLDVNVISSSAGGGSGGYVKALYEEGTLGSSESIVVGAAGTAGADTGTDGGDGGTSSFGSLITCNGGGGGEGVTSSNDNPAGGTGGTATGGQLTINGQQGFPGHTDGDPRGRVAGGSNPIGFGGIGADPTGIGGEGTGYGSGAGGSQDGTSADIAGVVGTAGVVIITEYTLST